MTMMMVVMGEVLTEETHYEKKLKEALYKKELKLQRQNSPEAIERRYWAQVDANNKAARIERARTWQVRPEFDKDLHD